MFDGSLRRPRPTWRASRDGRAAHRAVAAMARIAKSCAVAVHRDRETPLAANPRCRPNASSSSVRPLRDPWPMRSMMSASEWLRLVVHAPSRAAARQRRVSAMSTSIAWSRAGAEIPRPRGSLESLGGVTALQRPSARASLGLTHDDELVVADAASPTRWNSAVRESADRPRRPPDASDPARFHWAL